MGFVYFTLLIILAVSFLDGISMDTVWLSIMLTICTGAICEKLEDKKDDS